MHRSGTSMVARLLRQAGLYLGAQDQLLGADSANPEGHFEHVGFLEINNALLRRFGGSWDVPPELEVGWESRASLEDVREQARLLVAAVADRSPWGWKEPRTTLLVPFWRSIIADIRFVICVRNPLDVAKSLASRNQMAIDHGFCLWRQYMRAAIRDTEGCPRCLIFYEDFFRKDTSEISRLLKFCGLEGTAPEFVSLSGIRANLRHHDSGIAELSNDSSVLWYPKLLYLGLRAHRAAEYGSKAVEDESRPGVSGVLRLLDELHDGSRVDSLENALFKKSRELTLLGQESQEQLREKELQIQTLKNQLNELQQHAERLQKFSDAVRRTWAYRVYRNFIKPIHSS
jgi:hypothetical protein